MKGNIKIKKLLSCLLVFSMVCSSIQFGTIENASAATASTRANEERSFVEEVNISTNLSSDLIVDKLNDGTTNGTFVCENISLGTDRFVLESKDPSKYQITSAVSTGSMSVSQGGGSNNPSYTFSGIKNYNNFYININVKDIATGEVIPYKVLFKFDVESLLQFDNIRLTYTDTSNSVSTALIGYDSVEDDGYYRNTAGEDIKNVKVELLDGNAVMTTGITVSAVNGGVSGNTVTLIGGDNIIKVKVTRNNISKEYGLIIYKKGQAALKSLVPSTGSLSPIFNSDTFDYEMTVPTTQTTIAFTPTSIDNASTIKVNKMIVKTGKKSSDIKLSEGVNKIDVEVTTREGKSVTYTVKVNRTEKFRSSNLISLGLSNSSLSPGFNKLVYEYTASVENNVTSITVTPRAEDAAATIKVNGDKVVSGTASKYINLAEGSNIINIVVTDEKGYSSTYIVNVTRKYPKDNVNLGSLSVTDGTMSPKFDPETYLYSVKVARNIDKVRVNFTAQNEKAKIKIYKSGETSTKEYVSGQQSDSISLELGANLIIVEVKAEDGKSTTTYKLSIIRDKIEGINQWVLVSGEWTFYNGYGIQVKNQWVKYDNQWYFLDINGYMKTGWLLESGNWYYLNTNGIMVTGWFYEKGYWYYLQENGAMRANCWATYEGNWYFFNALGEMQTGWTLYKGYWYYLDSHGVMQKGWITYDKNKYYLNDDGSMRNGWLYDGKSWYFLDGEGKMIHGWRTIGGKKYYFGPAGDMKTGLIFLDGKWINLNNV